MYSKFHYVFDTLEIRTPYVRYCPLHI
jgi:hypothetical protein